MSKEELLKYLIAEIDIIMHDKDYRFENQDGTWYSRESCKDLTNEEVFEELRSELRQIADLEAKLAEKELELQQKDKLIIQENGECILCGDCYCINNDVRKIVKENTLLNQQLAESEKQVKHWHDLYNNRDKQFQSVRQRYHLLNKLQSNYDKKDKLHLAYMQCAELVEENEKLKQRLAEKDIELEDIKDHQKDLCLRCGGLTHEQYNQNKISFAIERLEEVKEWCENHKDSDEYDYVITYEPDEEDASGCMDYLKEYINNQLKELKKGIGVV